MNKKNKAMMLISLVLVGIFTFSIIFIGTGCKATPAAAKETTAAAAADYAYVGDPSEVYWMVDFVMGGDYWIPVYEMFKECGKQLNVTTKYGGTPEYDLQKFLAAFDQIVATKPTGIYLCPMQPDPFIEPINNAIKAGIAITTFATDSPKSNRQIFITSDNVNEGTIAANALAEQIGGKGKLAVTRNPGQLNHDIRCDTFIKVIKENWPDIEIVGDIATNGDQQKSYTSILQLAQKYPDLAGVFSPEALSGAGAAQAATELGGKIKILCVDVNNKILDQIKSGEIWGAINPNQGMQGYFGMLTLYVTAHPELVDPMNGDKALGKNPVALPFVDNGLTIVTKENVDYFYLDKYLARRNSKGIEE